MKDGRIRTIAQGSPVKDAIHEVSASSSASRSKPFSKEDVKESVPSGMNVEAARMISKSNIRIKRSNDVRATAEDGRTAEDGTGCGACQQVETVKKKEFRGRKPRTKKVTDKDNYRHYYILNSIAEHKSNCNRQIGFVTTNNSSKPEVQTAAKALS